MKVAVPLLLVGILVALPGCVTNRSAKTVNFSGRVSDVRTNGYAVDFADGRADVFDTATIMLDGPATAKGFEMVVVLDVPEKGPTFRTVGTEVRFSLPSKETKEYFVLKRERPSLAFVYASQTEGGSIVLQPFVHTYYWATYVLSNDAPLSKDGRYRLEKVNADGTVELTYYLSPELSQPVLVKSSSATSRETGKPTTFYVTESNARAQTATLRELLMK